MKKYVLLLFIGFAVVARGQNDSLNKLDLVEATIQDFFNAMKTSDTNLLKLSIYESLTLQTIYSSKDTKEPAIHFGDRGEFIHAVGIEKEQGKEWNELTSELKVDIDGNLAQAWMDYKFYIGDQYSHCGINAMQLFWDGQRWRIFHISDTRRLVCE